MPLEHHNYIADDIASYPSSCTYYDDTIEDYLNEKNVITIIIKLLNKLPDWLVQRWTRIVAKDVTSIPSFSRVTIFTIFITKEYAIVCNSICDRCKGGYPTSLCGDI